MPRDWDPHYEDNEQEWEPVILKRTVKKEIPVQHEIPLHRKIYLARIHAGITLQQISQKLKMKIGVYEEFESGSTVPDKSMLAKLRKYIYLKT